MAIGARREEEAAARERRLGGSPSRERKKTKTENVSAHHGVRNNLRVASRRHVIARDGVRGRGRGVVGMAAI